MNSDGLPAFWAPASRQAAVPTQGGAGDQDPSPRPSSAPGGDAVHGGDSGISPAGEAGAAEAGPAEGVHTRARAADVLHITTLESEYTLDVPRRLVRRQPVLGIELRLDSRWIPVRQVVLLEVGRPMVLLLDVRGDGVVTVRQSTTVLRIVRIG